MVPELSAASSTSTLHKSSARRSLGCAGELAGRNARLPRPAVDARQLTQSGRSFLFAEGQLRTRFEVFGAPIPQLAHDTMDDGNSGSPARHVPSAAHLAEFVMMRFARQPACVRKHYRQVGSAADQRQFATFYISLFAAIRRHVRSGFDSDKISRTLDAATPQQRPSFTEAADGLEPALQQPGAVDGRTARTR